VIDVLARRRGVKLDRVECNALVHAGDPMLVQPQTYMNRSGAAVQEAAAFYKLDLADLLIVVDDVALPAGRIRLRAGGSAGGHNGLGDIERALGTIDYSRLRIGIDAPPPRVIQADYVLGRFSSDQLQRLESALDAACDGIESWITDGIAKAMSRFNAGDA
jgi:PTH1 family peptidyl-tRNA hydrolase